MARRHYKSSVAKKVQLDLNVLLEHINTTSGLMLGDLQTGGFYGVLCPDLNLALIPKTDPYGLGTYMPDIRNVSIVGTIIDWIKVEIWGNVNFTTMTYNLLEEQALLLRPDGTVINTELQSPQFNMAGDVYIVVRHRSHLAIMSSGSVNLSGDAEYKFDHLSKVLNLTNNPYGQLRLRGTKYVMWSGDLNQDGLIDQDDIDIYDICIQYYTSCNYSVCDVTRDLLINIQDGTYILQNIKYNLESSTNFFTQL